jgi:hypothetical protein
MNRAVLAAFLCSATAPAATCDLTPQMSPFNASQWVTLEDSRVTTSRAMAAPNSFTPDAIQLPDATVLLLERSTAGDRSVDEMRAVVNALPVTSTAPNHEPESGLR